MLHHPYMTHLFPCAPNPLSWSTMPPPCYQTCLRKRPGTADYSAASPPWEAGWCTWAKGATFHKKGAHRGPAVVSSCCGRKTKQKGKRKRQLLFTSWLPLTQSHDLWCLTVRNMPGHFYVLVLGLVLGLVLTGSAKASIPSGLRLLENNALTDVWEAECKGMFLSV